MAKKGWTERDRFEDVKRPKFVRPKFDTLSVEQKQAILSTFNPDICSPAHDRRSGSGVRVPLS